MRRRAWLVDVDGTLALRGQRNPFNWRAAGDDSPNQPVIEVVRALASGPQPACIVVISGRHEIARDVTTAWLTRYSIPFSELVMRANGDFRSDEIVKAELLQMQIAPQYSVSGVIDDRDRVVKMWRASGFVCLQVADGDF